MNFRHSVGFVLEGMTGPGSGTWSRFESLARGLAESGLSIHVLTSPILQPALLELPISSVRLTPVHSKVRRFLNRRSIIEDFIRETSVEVIHIEAPPFPEALSAKSIASVHDLRYFNDSILKIRSAEGVYQRVALRRQVRNMSGLATLGPWAANEVVTRLGVDPAQVFVIPPIVEAPRNLKPGRNLSEARFVLVLGHLEQRKNVATVLRAASSPSWPEGIELVIAGIDSGEGANLNALATKSRCRVQFLGGVNESTKWQLLTDAEIVLLPSLMEGFGIVGVEAPLAGTPALVSDRTALPEISGDADAIVPALDHEAWAERIALVMSDRECRDRILSRQISSAQRFTSSAVIPQVSSVYQQLINGHQR